MIRDFAYEGEEGLDAYMRIFDATGLVFDFADNQFRSLATAATPFLGMTEKTAMNGTGYSAYIASIDVSNIYSLDEAKQLFWRVYNNATPADSDVSISELRSILVSAGRVVPETIAHVTNATISQLVEAKVINTYSELNLTQRTGIPPV